MKHKRDDSESVLALAIPKERRITVLLENAPSVLQLPPLYHPILRLPIHVQQLKVPPMMQRARAIPRQEQEDRHAQHRNQIERQEHDKLEDLAERKRAIHRRPKRLPQPLHRVLQVAAALAGCYQRRFHGQRRHGPVAAHEVLEPLLDQHGVEHVDLRLVDEEGFEEDGDDGGTLAEHEDGAVEPGACGVEDGEEGDLREVGPHEEVHEHEGGEEEAGQQAGADEGP